jgi:glycosyltransferase involved in cell wall biosynthesis
MINDKVSVIIPAYNRYAYIRRAIESVLNQSYKDIELIVVDDGSTDNTREILEDYEPRMLLLEHEGGANKGQSAAINLGLQNAQGEYIAILDSDDCWETNKIELQIAYLQQNPDVGLVYGNGIAVDENGEYLYDIYKPNHEEKNIPSSLLVDCYFFVPTNSLFRAEILELTGGFDESLRTAQDHDMGIRIAEVTKLAYINNSLFHYRRHDDSISRKRAGLRWRNGFIILDKARKRYPYPITTIIRRKAVLHFRMYQCLLEEKKYPSALLHLLLSGTYDPIRAMKIIFRREMISSPH